MRSRTLPLAGGAAAILVLLLGARAAAASGGDALPAPAWDLIKGLTWPGALVASLFSPVGKSLAGLIAAVTPARSTGGIQDQRLAEQVREVAEVLQEVSESVRRSSQVQEQTAAALVKVQQSLAILLDRTPR